MRFCSERGVTRRLRSLGRQVLLATAVVSLAGCASLKRWAYEGGDRDSWQKPTTVIASLQLKAGDSVADIGAGSGYFTSHLADAVGPKGRVFAVDIDEDMIALLRQRVADEGRDNVEIIAARPDDPTLPPESVDLIFTCNTYHHIEGRPAYFANIKKYLKPGGRVAVIDLNDKSWFTYLLSHWTPPEDIRKEMEAAGYRREVELDFLDYQSFQIFAVAE